MASPTRSIRDGLVVGLIAYAAVALFYAAFDLLAARGGLYTVNVLGRAVFRGLRDPTGLGLPMAIDTTAIGWYNGLHLVISLAIGMTVTTLVDQAERRPAQARLLLVTIVSGFVLTILAVGFASRPMRPVLPWWSIVVANSLAVVLAGLYLTRRRPGVWHRLTASPH